MYSSESQENIFVKHESLSPRVHSNASMGSAVSTEEIRDGLNMDSKRYALRWRHHQSTVVAEVGSLFRESALVDVTLACEDQRTYQAHKLVLSACSQYFQTLFAKHPSHQHPIIFLKDVDGDECEALLTFMYKGEVSVNQEQIPGILRVASSLQVRGLAEVETHSSRHSSPINTVDRGMHSPCPSSPATVGRPPKSITPVSEPTSPIPHSPRIITPISSNQEHGNCSLPLQNYAPSQSLPRPPPLAQDFHSPVSYLMKPPFDLSPGGAQVPLPLPPPEHERKRSEEKAQMPSYGSPQLRVKSDLGVVNWDGNVEMPALPSHPIRDGTRHPYLHHQLFSTFMNLHEPPVTAGSPGYGTNNPQFSIRDPLNRLTGNETRIHKCEYCSRKFKRKDHLKTHVRIHTGERPYRCKICSRGFIQSQQVKIHMKVHNRGDERDPPSLVGSSILGGNGSGGGLSALSSLYSELSHYGVQQDERLMRSTGSHSSSHCEHSSDQLLGPQTDGNSDNDLSLDMPENEARGAIPDSRNADAGSSSRRFAHHLNLLTNKDHSPSPEEERSPTGEVSSRINDLNSRSNDVDSRHKVSPTGSNPHSHMRSPPIEENSCLKDASPHGGSYPLASNLKK